MSDHASEHGAASMHHAHIVPARIFVGVLMALLVLTFFTVLVSRFDFGNFNLLIAMAIAAVKAALVISIFMHLRWDTAINNIVFLSSFLFVALLFIFTIGDLVTRGGANSIHFDRAPVDFTFLGDGFVDDGAGH